MAQSIKLKDDTYIDTSGIWDATEEKTQAAINSELKESLSTNIITESVLCPAISIPAGTIGTYVKADSVSVAKSGYTPIQASLNNVGHPGAYNVVPVLRRQTNTLYFLYYRVGTAAVTQNAGDVEVNVTYVKS